MRGGVKIAFGYHLRWKEMRKTDLKSLDIKNA